MAQTIRACMISIYVAGGACLTFYGYHILETTVYGLTNTIYSPANFTGTDAFSQDMQTTLHSTGLSSPR